MLRVQLKRYKEEGAEKESIRFRESFMGKIFKGRCVCVSASRGTSLSIKLISSRWIFVAEPYMDTSLPKLVPSYSLSDKIPSTVLHLYRTIVRDTRLRFFKKRNLRIFRDPLSFLWDTFFGRGRKEKREIIKKDSWNLLLPLPFLACSFHEQKVDLKST